MENKNQYLGKGEYRIQSIMEMYGGSKTDAKNIDKSDKNRAVIIIRFLVKLLEMSIIVIYVLILK